VAALFVLVTAGLGGYVAATLASPVVHSRYFPWIVGRALGLAAYLCLAVLVLLGIWLRHPWRFRWAVLHAETALRYHAALAAATIVLVIGHLVSLASDSYAGVGWVGAILPGRSAYRTVPVAVGVAAFWACLLVAGTARLGARLVGRRWLPVHRLALPIFAAVFVHGVLSGTDTPRLRAFYVVTGMAVATVWLTRVLAARPSSSLAAARAGSPVEHMPGEPAASTVATSARRSARRAAGRTAGGGAR
jgi:hypothetical protein